MAKTKKEIEILISGDNESKKAFQSVEKSLGKVDQAVGETRKGFSRLDHVIGEIAGNLGTMAIDATLTAVTDTIGQTTAAADALQKSLMFEGLDDTSIKNISADMIYLQDAFGLQMTESVNAADRVMTQFGTTSEDAMDAVRLGAELNLDRFGDLSDTLNEYSQDFADLGFSAQETMAIINTGLEAGARDTDAIGDAWNEFGIRIKDPAVRDSIAGINSDMEQLVHLFQTGDLTQAEAFTAIRDQLLAIEDPIERNAAGVALFGTKWEDMGQDAFEAMLQTSQALDNGSVSVDEMTSTQQTLQQALAEVKAEIQAAFVPALIDMMDTMIPIIQEYGPQIAEWFGTNVPAALDGATAAFNAVTTAVGFLSPVIDIMIAIWNHFINVVDLVIGIIVNLVAVLDGAITPMQAVINIGNDVKDVFGSLADMVNSLISKVFKLNSAFASLKPPDWLSDVGNTLGGAAKTLGIPGFADGGTFTGGNPIIVGERGPEMIVPRAPGTVIPNERLRSSPNISMSINVQGNADQSTVAQIEQVLNRSIDKLLTQGNI